MLLTRNKLYLLLFISCCLGYIWLYVNLTGPGGQSSFDLCLVKHVTNIPCPSCGATRSVLSIMKGQMEKAFMINPLGFLVAIIMLLSPIWIITDWLRKENTLFNTYQKIEVILRKPLFAVPAILLVIINWLWNISKGL
ncbi:DUF2752 domain-containing protein [Pseudopedobacter beijingensis]|uniref:DUF2752 domain-containing protein n=1 Tax=Pseudopedobacter beijingensis TaxID=1207056 RepID=A0ABW4IE19_9SPHI